jgi:hypothetical protein
MMNKLTIGMIICGASVGLLGLIFCWERAPRISTTSILEQPRSSAASAGPSTIAVLDDADAMSDRKSVESNPPPIVERGEQPSKAKETRSSATDKRVPQVRSTEDLKLPEPFADAQVYAKSSHFNQGGSPADLSALATKLELWQDEYGRLSDVYQIAVEKALKARAEAGLAEAVPIGVRAPMRTVEDGTVFSSVSLAGSSVAYLVTLRHGEDATVDVAVDDLWKLVTSAELEIANSLASH